MNSHQRLVSDCVPANPDLSNLIQQSLDGAWQFRQSGSLEWLPAAVPGCAHTDLLSLGRIPDPFIDENEKLVQWVAEAGWEYRRRFTVNPEMLRQPHIDLVCEGLDTLAEVQLNGQPLGSADNMFRTWRWEVAARLTPGENELLVRFQSPLGHIRACQAVQPLTGGGDLPGGPYLRKAPYQWGWDWGPKLPPTGIWKSVRLEGRTGPRLEEFRVEQVHESGRVRLQVQARASSGSQISCHLLVQLHAPDGGVLTGEAAFDGACACLEIEVPNPQLWWPNGSGEQPLYRLNLALHAGGNLLDNRSCQLGLRTLVLRRELDAWGESFLFVVNDVPVFARGANWIPADSFPTRVTPARLEHLLGSAAAAHMNMLRVWGGGYYEDDRFYDLCDQLGILVWQDFMFACGIYPSSDDFAENVREEAVQQVRRLRGHTCLALWCGNNEMEQGWVDWGWNHPGDPANQHLKAGYNRLFHHLLPGVVAAEDPGRPYWPSSASSGIPFAEPNSEQRGDMHYWDVWHGRKPFSAYRSQFPRFMSEFGFQSLPPYATIQAFATPAEQNLTSSVMEHHQRSGSGNSLILSQMAAHYRMPKDFSSLVYVSMILQAEGIRSGVEHWRRNRERVSGTLYWQLNDCWPAASWSSIDCFGRWKALHYAAQRFYAPMLLSVEQDGRRVCVHLTNDLAAPWEGSLRWRLETLAGERLAKGELKARAAPLINTLLCTLDFNAQVNEDNCRSVVLVCELWQELERRTWCVCRFSPDKHLSLLDPGLETHLSLEGETLIINLDARSLALFVELSLEGADVIFSDNYFDLPAGMLARVTAPLPASRTLEWARAALRARSLVDTYA